MRIPASIFGYAEVVAVDGVAHRRRYTALTNPDKQHDRDGRPALVQVVTPACQPAPTDDDRGLRCVQVSAAWAHHHLGCGGCGDCWPGETL